MRSSFSRAAAGTAIKRLGLLGSGVFILLAFSELAWPDRGRAPRSTSSWLTSFVELNVKSCEGKVAQCPLEAVEVTLTDQNTGRSRPLELTNEEGYLSFDSLPSASYRLDLRKAGLEVCAGETEFRLRVGEPKLVMPDFIMKPTC